MDEQKIIEVIIRGQQANSTLREIKSAARVLNAELGKLPVNSEAFEKKAAELQSVNKRLKSIKDDVNGVSAAWKNIAAGFTVGAIITRGLSAIKQGFQESMQLHREFEASLKNLQAITGVTDQDLQFYGESAIEMGVKVKGGAVAVVEAYKLIGSAKPELLENKEAMQEVTAAAILLSQAAGLELPEASTRLTDALNQFGAPARDAAKYVDVLAAAAKYGAAEVPDITEALLKFGVAAKSANIDIYESSGAIELLAEKGLKGAEAGTQLRNVFAKMSAVSVLPQQALDHLERAGVDIKILENNALPLSERLKELSKISGDAGAITKVFGLENKIAGEVLISNLPRLEALTKSVREHGVAQEQAAINTDSENQRLLEQENRINNLSLSIGSKLTPAWGNLKEFALLTIESITGSIQEIFSNNALLKGTMESLGASADQAKKLAASGFTDIDTDNVKTLTGLMSALDMTQKGLSQNFASGKATLGDYDKTIKNLTAQMLKQEVTTNTGATKFYLLKDAIASLKKEYAELNAETADPEPGKIIDTRTKEEIAAAERKNAELITSTKKMLAEIADQKVNAIVDDQLRETAKAKLDNVRRVTEINLSLVSDSLKNEALESQKNTHEKAIQDIEAKYKTKRAENEAEYLKNKKDALKKAKEDELNLYKDEEAIMDGVIQENLTKQLAQLLENNTLLEAERKKNKDTIIEGTRQLAQEVSNTLFSAQQARVQRELGVSLQASSVLHDSETASLQARLSSGKITQDKFDKEKLASDKKFAASQLAIKKEAFEKEKRLKIAQVGMNLAIEISNAAVAASQNPLNAITGGVAGLTQFGIAAGIAVTRSAVQVAAIKTQKFAAGGYNSSNDPQGYTNGPTYFTNSASGKDFIAGEAGREWIASNWMLDDPKTAPVIKHLEAIRVSRGFAAGGSNSTSTTMPSFAPAATSNQDNAIIEKNTAAINRLNARLDDGLVAVMGWDQYLKDSDKIGSAKSAARLD